MNLAIDIGNTLAKLAVIDDGQVVDFQKTEKIDSAFVEKILEENPEIEAAIIVSTGEYETAWEQIREGYFQFYLQEGRQIHELITGPVTIKYMTDSKGYYQPVYAFITSIDGQEDYEIYIPAIEQ